MKRHAHSIFWFLYWGLAAFAAIVALLLFYIKIVVEDVDQYRLDIQQSLSEQLSAQVHIASIEGAWRGWQPVISLRGVSVDQIEAEKGASFGLLEGVIALDIGASLRAFTPVFSQFDLQGLTLKYDQTLASKDSATPAQETSSSETKTERGSNPHGSSDLLSFLLMQRAINIENTRIVVIPKSGDEIIVEPIQLHLQHDGVLHQLKVDADLVTASGKADLKFVAEVEGDPAEKAANFYLKLSGLDQQLLNPWLQLMDVQLDGLQAEQEIWGQSYKGKLAYLTGKTSIENFSYQDYVFEQFTVQSALVRRDHSFQVQITDLIIGAAEEQFTLPRMSLDIVRNGIEIKPKKLMIDRIDLQRLSDLVIKQPFMPKSALEVVNTLSAEGVVENLLVSWSKDAELSEFKLLADLSNVGIDAWDDVPELKGINGLLKADIAGGEIHLQSDDFIMQYPTLFDYRWQYQHADGVIGWRFEDKGVVVASQLLNLKNEGVSASGRFSIYLPFSRDEQPLLNLQIGMKNSDGLHAKYYIPPKEVGVKTYDWLVAAIKRGHINQAGFVLNGVTRSRLDDYQLPSVQMFFNLSEASFEYQPGWPAVNKADSFVFFRNGELTAEAKGGKIYDSDIDFAWVHLPVSTDKLLLTGSVNGSTKDIERLLAESPLRKEVGEELAAWEMEGKTATRIEIDLPLRGNKTPRVDVNSSIVKGRFHSKHDGIDFSNINGSVRYSSSNGLSSNKLNAQLFEQPITAAIRTQKRKTAIDIRGVVKADYIRKWLDLDLLRVAQGELAYSARLDMCPGKSCNQLVIKSDLKGIALSAPSPLAKTAAQSTQLTIISDLGRQFKDDRSVVRFNLGNQLRGVMLNSNKKVSSGRFTLGGEKPTLPMAKGIWVNGRVAMLDYDQLEQFFKTAGFSESSEGKSVSTQSDHLLKEVDLKIDQFSFEDVVLDDLKVILAPDVGGWMLTANSPQVGGKLWMPEDSSLPYKVKLGHLRIEKDESDSEQSGVAITPPVDPAVLPKLDFSVENFELNKLPLGSWRFILRPTSSGAVVKDISGNMHGSSVRGELRWDKNGKELSDLTVKLDSQDFGKVLDAWGISDTLETKSLNAYLQLSWSGAPWKFEVGKSNGEMQFTAKNGRLLDVGNSGNILRIFGILNLQSLGRRLRLDFTDLVKTGVAFDEMKADYSIKNGIAHTSTPFMMTGPSANMAMTGSLNLMNETVNKEIEVALPVTDNIPLVSVLLGAPQVAGAVFLFDKLIGDPLAKFTTVKYRMNGDWGNPEIDIDLNQKKEQPELDQDLHDG
ncbi:YhdP family protein [Neptuniibacter sp. SY11_33]|uniref:YhdP family protein n=1 Tax=Neptuniibacter sp. SY11_33 TaxID=3398215 RepID=UPI0039F5A3CB